jgi:23S rRNA (cytidine1920-2'-O)/16S rRNA (cytidine1409-2'-O)-methyltransferase
MDRTNARYLESLPELVDLVTADVSFISLKLILPAVRGWLRDRGHIVALIKPQFEAGREHVGRGGVVRDSRVHRIVLEDITAWAKAEGLALRGLIASPLTGAAGNVEFLAHWLLAGQDSADVNALISASLGEQNNHVAS